MQLTQDSPTHPPTALPEPAPGTSASGQARRSVRTGKRHQYHLASAPALAPGIWLGGGLFVLLLVVVVVALVLRR